MRPGYTGHLIERELFGEVDKKKILSQEGHLNFKDSMLAAKDAQPYEDPSDPEPRFANDLHANIADLLGLEDYNDLKIFTGVHSYLDYAHGVDAWVELNYNNKIYRVELDVTSNPVKEEDITVLDKKIVFYWPKNGLDSATKEDKEKYVQKLDKITRIIAEVFAEMIEQ